jgi:hypothetical protein
MRQQGTDKHKYAVSDGYPRATLKCCTNPDQDTDRCKAEKCRPSGTQDRTRNGHLHYRTIRFVQPIDLNSILDISFLLLFR